MNVNTASERALIDLAEANGATDSLCSFHKLLLGAAEAGVSTKPLMVANTSLACDANQLTFRELANFWNVSRAAIDVPYRADEEAVDYVADQLRDMARLAEECAGKHLEEDRLRACVARGQKTLENFKAYLQCRHLVHFPEVMTPELLHVIANHIYLGNEASLRYSELLLEDVKKAPHHGNEKKILWMHIMPNWQESMKSVFQGNDRVEVIGCDFASDALVDLDLEEMAACGLDWKKDRTISSTCTVFAESEVVSLIADNHDTADIIHALAKAVASKTCAMVKRAKGEGPFIMTGGVARNACVERELETRLDAPIFVGSHPDMTGAIGAALFSMEAWKNKYLL